MKVTQILCIMIIKIVTLKKERKKKTKTPAVLLVSGKQSSDSLTPEFECLKYCFILAKLLCIEKQ